MYLIQGSIVCIWHAKNIKQHSRLWAVYSNDDILTRGLFNVVEVTGDVNRFVRAAVNDDFVFSQSRAALKLQWLNYGRE